MTNNIKEPAHYKANKIEPIDFIIERNFSLCEGNVIKYISRLKIKNVIEDYKKEMKQIKLLIKKTHKITKKIKQINFIIKNNFNFCVSNVIKSVSRYKRKNGIEYLKKARQYIDFLIKKEVEKSK